MDSFELGLTKDHSHEKVGNRLPKSDDPFYSKFPKIEKGARIVGFNFRELDKQLAGIAIGLNKPNERNVIVPEIQVLKFDPKRRDYVALDKSLGEILHDEREIEGDHGIFEDPVIEILELDPESGEVKFKITADRKGTGKQGKIGDIDKTYEGVVMEDEYQFSLHGKNIIGRKFKIFI